MHSNSRSIGIKFQQQFLSMQYSYNSSNTKAEEIIPMIRICVKSEERRKNDEGMMTIKGEEIKIKNKKTEKK